jgi:GNAT superfamily N-acetyltransferase
VSPHQDTTIIAQFMRRATAILTAEGIRGLARRIKERLGRKPLCRNGYILGVSLERLDEIPLPCPGLEVKRVKPTDDDELEALATFGEDTASKIHLLQRLTQGQLCYVAQSGQHITASQWVISGEFQDSYLDRTIQLAQDQVYLEGAFTAPEFRGKGIMAYLVLRSLEDMARESKKQAIAFIAPNNTSSLRCIARLGAKRIGRIGFIEILGIRFHYLFGREALPQTTQRFYVTRM